MHRMSTELAKQAFDADAALSAALAEFQSEEFCGRIHEEARRAAGHGLSWHCRPSEPGFYEVRLRHKAGAEICAEGKSVTALLAGLLGHPLAQDIAVLAAAQAAEPDKICDPCILSPGEQSRPEPTEDRTGLSYTCDPAGDTTPCAGWDPAARPQPWPSYAQAAPEPSAAKAALAAAQAQVAAESLAAFTGGAVVTEPSEYVPDPATPLTDQEKALGVQMLREFDPPKRLAFTIAFRSAFRVPREAKGIKNLIVEWRHLQFFQTWETEATGGVAA